MKRTKLFKTNKQLNASLIDEVANLNVYHFTILFTPGSNCSLNTLLVKFSTQTSWTPVITHPATDNDGEITFKIGEFYPGTNLDFTFSVYGISDIPAVKAVLTNINTGISRKLSPNGSTNKSITQAEIWNQNLFNKTLH